MSNRRYNVKDFVIDQIKPQLEDIEELAEQQHLKLCELVDIDEQKREDVMANLDIIKLKTETIREVLGFYS